MFSSLQWESVYKWKKSLSVCLFFNYLDNLSSDLLHTWWVFCWRPKEVQWRVWSCLGERFSRKLQAAIPEAKQLARSEQAHLEHCINASQGNSKTNDPNNQIRDNKSLLTSLYGVWVVSIFYFHCYDWIMYKNHVSEMRNFFSFVVTLVLLFQTWLCCFCLDWLFLQVSCWKWNVVQENQSLIQILFKTHFPAQSSICLTLLFSSVSLNVSPNRQQFFTGESVSLSCEEEEGSVGWTLKRLSVVQTETCGATKGFGRLNGSSCIVSDLSPLLDRGIYWCEHCSGQRSIKVTITVSGRKASVCRVSMSDGYVDIVWVFMEKLTIDAQS